MTAFSFHGGMAGLASLGSASARTFEKSWL